MIHTVVVGSLGATYQASEMPIQLNDRRIILSIAEGRQIMRKMKEMTRTNGAFVLFLSGWSMARRSVFRPTRDGPMSPDQRGTTTLAMDRAGICRQVQSRGRRGGRNGIESAPRKGPRPVCPERDRTSSVDFGPVMNFRNGAPEFS